MVVFGIHHSESCQVYHPAHQEIYKLYLLVEECYILYITDIFHWIRVAEINLLP